jgi:transposase
VQKSRINSQKIHTGNEESPSAAQIVIVTAVLGFLQLSLTKTIAKRVVCFLLLVGKVRTSLITKLVGISAQTISKIRKAALSGNIEFLFTIKSGGGRKNKLQTVEQAIIDMIDTNNYHTLNQIKIMIEEKFGIVTSVSTISRLLKKHGIKRLKSGSFPAKADPVAQRTFYETRLVPLMEDAKSGLITLLSMDASHFVMGGYCLVYSTSTCQDFFRSYALQCSWRIKCSI